MNVGERLSRVLAFLILVAILFFGLVFFSQSGGPLENLRVDVPFSEWAYSLYGFMIGLFR